jgi:tetratricopeptide (TPR) repeat protein
LLEHLGRASWCRTVRAVPAPTAADTSLLQQEKELQVLNDLGRYAEVIERSRPLIAQARQAAPHALPWLERSLAIALRETYGSTAEVADSLWQAVGDADAVGDDEAGLRIRTSLVDALCEQFDRFEEADVVARESENRLRLLGNPAHLEAELVQAKSILAYHRHRYEEALRLSYRELDLSELAFGQLSASAADAHSNLAIDLAALGRREEAIAEYRKTLEILRQMPLQMFADKAITWGNLAVNLGHLGRPGEALAAAEQGAACLPAVARNARSYWLDMVRGRALEDLGRREEAEVLYRRVIAAGDEAKLLSRARALAGMSRILLARSNAAAALPLAQQAVQLAENGHAFAPVRAECQFALARALWESGGDRLRALALARGAAKEIEGAVGDVRLEEMTRWIESHQ